MGTVVFADANLKIFLTVSEDARIERRIAQLKSEAEKAGAAMTDEAIASLRAQMRVEIQERDIRDSSRAVAPLKPAADAITVDNSSKTLEETLEEILKLARERGL
jgi:cytidylate kinase